MPAAESLELVLATLNRIVSFDRCQDFFFDLHKPLSQHVGLNGHIRPLQARELFQFLAGDRVLLAQGLEFTTLSDQRANRRFVFWESRENVMYTMNHGSPPANAGTPAQLSGHVLATAI
ncbi:MAG: hypothetical protein ACREDW_11885, partial [Aestuariivirgaceae bacterium]